MFGPEWSYNFKKLKVNEVYNIVFASFVNINYVNTTKNSYKKYKKFINTKLPKTQILFHNNLSPQDLYKMTLHTCSAPRGQTKRTLLYCQKRQEGLR